MTTYCEVNDVERIIGTDLTGANTFYDNTDIQSFIEEAESEVDQIVHTSWKTQEITDEYHDKTDLINIQDGRKVMLDKRFVTDITKLERWNGSEYEDLVQTGTQGRGEDYWVKGRQGTVFLRSYTLFNTENAIRVSYKYDQSQFNNGNIPKDIQQATAITAALNILRSDKYSNVIDRSTDDQQLNRQQEINELRSRRDELLEGRIEVVTFSL